MVEAEVTAVGYIGSSERLGSVVLGQQKTVTNSPLHQLNAYNQRIEQLEGQKKALSENVERQCEQAQIIGQHKSDWYQRLSESQAELDAVRSKFHIEVDDLASANSTLERQKGKQEDELSVNQYEVADL